MKLLFCMVLTLFITTSYQKTFSQVTQIWQSYVLEHSEKCLKETGADYDLAMRVLPYSEYVDDHKVKCFLFCIAKGLFIAYEDGSVHHKNILDRMNVKDVEILKKSDVVNKCLDIKLRDPCESFYAAAECISTALESAMEKN